MIVCLICCCVSVARWSWFVFLCLFFSGFGVGCCFVGVCGLVLVGVGRA